MKYLKLFEGYTKEDYYSSLSMGQYLNYCTEDSIKYKNTRNINLNNFKRLKRFLNKMGIDYVFLKNNESMFAPYQKDVVEVHAQVPKDKKFPSGPKWITISKCDHEYYLLYIYEAFAKDIEKRFFLCDNLDGLERCIKDNMYDQIPSKFLESIDDLDNYYEQIPIGDHDNLSMLDGRSDFINKGEIEKVIKYLNKISTSYLKPREELTFKVNYNGLSILISTRGIGKMRKLITKQKYLCTITKNKDDYWLVKYTETPKMISFKCDSFIGLKKFISKLVNIKIKKED